MPKNKQDLDSQTSSYTKLIQNGLGWSDKLSFGKANVHPIDHLGLATTQLQCLMLTNISWYGWVFPSKMPSKN